MKKLLVSDWDGTFYLSDENVRKNVEKIKSFRREGNLFVLATGNNYARFIEVVKQYQVEYDYLILDQGSFVISSAGDNIFECFISPEVINDLCDMMKNINGNINVYNKWKECKEGDQDSITKVSTRITDIDKAKELTKKLNDTFKGLINAYTMIFPDINIVEVVSAQTDKREAINRVINTEGILRSNVYVVGDGYNDMTMIDCFNGYCMNNSVQELLDSCSNHVNSVSELVDLLQEKEWYK